MVDIQISHQKSKCPFDSQREMVTSLKRRCNATAWGLFIHSLLSINLRFRPWPHICRHFCERCSADVKASKYRQALRHRCSAYFSVEMVQVNRTHMHDTLNLIDCCDPCMIPELFISHAAWLTLLLLTSFVWCGLFAGSFGVVSDLFNDSGDNYSDD